MQCSAALGPDAIAALIEDGIIIVTYLSDRAGQEHLSPKDAVAMFNQWAEDGWRSE